MVREHSLHYFSSFKLVEIYFMTEDIVYLGNQTVLERNMHSGAWRVLGMGEPGRLPSMGSHRVGHD